MVILQSSDGPVDFDDALVAAVAHEAEHAADLIAECFRHSGLREVDADGRLQPITLPANFLLEMGAFLQFAEWQGQGLLDQLGPDAPRHEERVARFLKSSDQASLSSVDDTVNSADPEMLPLTRQLLRIQIRRLSWEGQSLFGANVVLDRTPNEDSFVAELAAILWANRHLQQEHRHQ